MFSFVWFPTATSCFTYPIKVNTNTDFVLGTEIEKSPSILVIVPEVVPFTCTLTPGIPSLRASTTLPVMVFCCPIICPAKANNVMKHIRKTFNRFFIEVIFISY